MNKMTLILRMLTVFVVCLIFSSAAQAQATRTWVSGVGDDVNPCSRTAPCKTFAGAISKTAAGGEINVLDSAGYGAVTITKAMTIDGSGAHASILHGSVNGVIINPGINDQVVLRNLSINGAGTVLGTNSIRYLAGRSLRVENCVLQNVSNHGIDMNHAGTGAGELTVYNSSFTNIGSVAIRSIAANVQAAASISKVSVNRAAFGVDVLGDELAAVSNSVFSHITNQGVVAEGTSVINVVGSVFFKNGTGVASFVAGSSIRLANNDIFNNTTGVSVIVGGTCDRFSNNRIFGNGTNISGTCNPQTNQ
jgi:hypothetical protein